VSHSRSSIRRAASGVAARLRQAVRQRSYRRALADGGPAGELTWVFDPAAPPSPLVELRLPADTDRAQAAAWCARQTLAELTAVGLRADGSAKWRIEPGPETTGSTRPSWFAAPGGLPDLLPSHLESCMLVAAAEAVDAVVLRQRVDAELESELAPFSHWLPAAAADQARDDALYADGSWRYDPASDTVSATRNDLLVKVIDANGVGAVERDGTTFNLHRRGPYLASHDLGPILEVPVRDAARLHRRPVSLARPTVLVTVPFLARGGAEHTLFETMRELSPQFDFAIATLAPHRPEIGDRRGVFRAITERIYCLGDLVHPAAMYGMLVALIDSTNATVLDNANSTTLVHDFAPRLKADRPDLRIVDHLYDHRVGYIDRYTPELLDSVDACVAENHRIAQVLTTERGWPAERTPVIWPCGRPPTAFPPESERARVRRWVRTEFGIDAGDLIILTAARMHSQKRPLDLVKLAERVRDLEHVHFLLVGGGELEDEVDEAIIYSRARIRRLPFRNDIPELIVGSDVGCLVSEFEGLPVFMLECLQASTPFLGTDVGDMGEVLRRTGAGIVVDQPGDLAALEAGVRRMADPDEWARLARNAGDAGPQFVPAACAAAYGAAFLGTTP